MQVYSNDAWSSSAYVLGDEFGNIGIKSVFALEGLPQKEPISGNRRRLQDVKRIQRRAKKMSTLEYFRPLEKAAVVTNQNLEGNDRPLRVSVYRKGANVMMEVIVSKPDGASPENIKKDITEDDFSKLIHDLTDVKGLIIDESA
jgi:ABC-type xylose transport system substrate-binding protein